MAEKKVNKSLAKQTLWERGNLTYLLKGKQIELYDYIREQKSKIITICCGRRWGKSTILSMLAIETCLRTPGSIVKMISPTKGQIEEIIKQVMRPLLEDCPKHLLPDWKEARKRYEFQNGSEIQIAATEGGGVESIRGGSCSLAVVDEAAFTSDLEYCVKNILVPAVSTTKGKIILCSTPNFEDPNHPFNTQYVAPLEEAGTLKKFTIYDAPMLDAEAIKETIEAYGGVDNPRFQCLDKDTLIHTKYGFKKIKDISIGEEVYSHTGNLRKVLNKFENIKGSRKVYNIQTNDNIGSKCTEDHKLYVVECRSLRHAPSTEAKWKTVSDILTSQSRINRHYVKVPLCSVEENTDMTPELAYLCGWNLAEGSTNKGSHVLSLNHKDDFKTIDDLTLKIWGKRYKIYDFSKSHILAYLCSKKALEFYKQFGTGAANKHIPIKYKNMSKDCKLALLRGLFLGDGHYNLKSRTAGLCGISKNLITEVSDMLATLGISSSFRRSRKEGPGIIKGRVIHNRDCYTLQINRDFFSKFLKLIHNIDFNDKKRRSNSVFDEKYIYVPINKIEEITNYSEEIVYDLEIEQDHSYKGSHITFHNCEFMCNLQIDQEKMVVGEFNKELQEKIVREVPFPDFFDAYVAMDIGFIDMTAVLFAYYDFRTQQTVILDELVINGTKLTTDYLAANIKEKEFSLFQYPSTKLPVPVYLRVADNNNQILLNDLNRLHNLIFVPTAKDNKDAQINELKMRLKTERIIIHPRCKNLIYHLKSAKWDKQRKSFIRIPSHPHEGLLGGHCDALDALLYLIRNVQTYKNPYPANYGNLTGSNIFHRNQDFSGISKELNELAGKMMNLGHLKSFFKKSEEN